ncbi:hypothetical protein predicted by Glimmer/Critica [Sorangium cellulosum So ce56]|uniref:Uncharacterized protein n=1 Tax=Sorangium cellulosum (strain So ce56) TaxID=448385 RepID=A9EPD4_SORC5|nr:hypothetical protein predicted by Glimmer/Critica [Sorangium cellulosum So ce56]
MVAEVEADVREARALCVVRTGRPRSPIPPRPCFLAASTRAERREL